MPKANEEIAHLLHELAVLTELEEGNPQAFRVRAYQNAERAVRGLSRDVSELSAPQLADVRGIGRSIAAKIREYVDTGTIAKLEELRSRHPAGALELLRVPGIGAKTIRLLREVLGVEDLADLRAAVDAGRIRELPGMGEKTERNLGEALDRLDEVSHEHRLPIAAAMPVAEGVVAALDALDAAEAVAYTGSLRRFRETIGDLDVLVVSTRPDAVMDAFAGLDLIREVSARGDTKASATTFDGLAIDLRVVEPGHLGAALLYFTGSKAHNIRLRQRAIERAWTLNEYALSDTDTGEIVAADTEAAVYGALDLAWIPPELREDDGEVEAAAADALPDLVEVDDLRGDLHDHSDYSGDGRATLEAMVDAAAARGLAYFAVTDHGENLRVNGVSRAGLKEQRSRLRRLQERYEGLRLLHGVELNIDPDGGLDYDDDFLDGFDWCVASVHSHFNLPVERQTSRLVAAMRHRAVNVIGHLSGRRIGKRAGIDLDLETVFDVAVETGTAIEVNANLERLDASAEALRQAVDAGVTLVVSSDAHDVAELDNARYGVRNARRGRVPRELVANTWDTGRFLDWAAEKPERV